ncbi:MAG: hypothetical protein F2667_04410 [Actinobacteria bacterium]|nr:hypothetical protein [Actinomycetota bacterium]
MGTWQPVAALRVDAVAWAVAYLQPLLAARPEEYAAGAVVARRESEPSPRPDCLVVVRRDGGLGDSLFDRPRLSVRTFALTSADAGGLAAVVSALLMEAPGSGPCTRVSHLSGPNEVEPPAGEAYPSAYQLFEVTLRAGRLT